MNMICTGNAHNTTCQSTANSHSHTKFCSADKPVFILGISGGGIYPKILNPPPKKKFWRNTVTLWSRHWPVPVNCCLQMRFLGSKYRQNSGKCVYLKCWRQIVLIFGTQAFWTYWRVVNPNLLYAQLKNAQIRPQNWKIQDGRQWRS